MSFQSTDEQDRFRLPPAVQALIAINVLIYFVQLTVVGDAMRGALAFELSQLTREPWTAVTYMFVHAGFWHLAVNMYGLWLFGQRVERAWTSRGFVGYYLLCGIGGWLVHLMFVRNGFLLGASAGVFGVMLAYAMRWPDDEILLFFVIPLKMKWAVVLFAAIDLAFGLAGGGGTGVGHFAHLGGFATGWLYLRWTQTSPSLERLRQRMSQVPDIPDETPRAIPRSHPRPRERGGEIDEVVARSNAITAKRVTGSTLTKRVSKSKVEALNGVLDKISRQGLGSLTAEEKKLLEEMSRWLRDS
ncbi:MAG: rhomboid family intramembrane serine protease [Anaerolineae bacterium]|nr:rhomboid family intramembrane serine protease [Gemmatimonadaceae bacterium]